MQKSACASGLVVLTLAMAVTLGMPASFAQADIAVPPGEEIEGDAPSGEELEAMSNEEQPGGEAPDREDADEPDADDAVADDASEEGAEVVDDDVADAAVEKDAAPKTPEAAEKEKAASGLEGEASEARILPLRLVAVVMAAALAGALVIVRLRKKDRA